MRGFIEPPEWDGDRVCPQCGEFAQAYGAVVGVAKDGRWEMVIQYGSKLPVLWVQQI